MPEDVSNTNIFMKKYQRLLTEEEENRLFQDWYNSNPEAYEAFIDPNNVEVTTFVGGDDEKYLSPIIEAYGPLVHRCIKELSGYKMAEDEMLSEGLVALVEAARRFDSSKARFSTYAKMWCKGVMWSFITKNFFVINICTNHNRKKLFFAMRRLIATELTQHNTFKMTNVVAEQLAKENNCEVVDVFNMYEMFQNRYISLDVSINDDSLNGDFTKEITVGEIIPDNTNVDPFEVLMRDNATNFQNNLIRNTIDDVLTDREKDIFHAQCMSDDNDDFLTLHELGDKYLISKERVRQIRIASEKKINREITKYMESMNLKASDVF